MNKSELINAIASGSNVTKADASRVLEAFMLTVTDALKSGDEVVLIGFGTFSRIKRAARTGRNPQTGKEIHIPETKAPKFKAGKALKEALQEA